MSKLTFSVPWAALIIDKNRHGSVEDIPVRWDYRTLRLSPRVPAPESDGWTARIGRNPK